MARKANAKYQVVRGSRLIAYTTTMKAAESEIRRDFAGSPLKPKQEIKYHVTNLVTGKTKTIIRK